MTRPANLSADDRRRLCSAIALAWRATLNGRPSEPPGCGHGHVLMESALLHWRALSLFLDGPHKLDDMSPADLGLAGWPMNPGKAREDRASVNQLVFHLTWAYVTTIDGVGFTVGHLFDELHTRLSLLTSMLDGEPWAAELRDVRDLLGEGQGAFG